MNYVTFVVMAFIGWCIPTLISKACGSRFFNEWEWIAFVIWCPIAMIVCSYFHWCGL
jgi:hypothetical protein